MDDYIGQKIADFKRYSERRRARRAAEMAGSDRGWEAEEERWGVGSRVQGLSFRFEGLGFSFRVEG